MPVKLNLCTRIKAFAPSDGDSCIAGPEGHEGDHVFGRRLCEVSWDFGDGGAHPARCRLPYLHRCPHRPAKPGEDLCPTCKGLGGGFTALMPGPAGAPGFRRCDTCSGWGVVGSEVA